MDRREKSARPRALFVSRDFVTRQRWASWLQVEGLDVATCAAPGAMVRCPRALGLSCVLREWADAAAIDVGAEHDAQRAWQSLTCKKLRDDTRTLLVYDEGIYPSLADTGPAVSHPIEREQLVNAIRQTLAAQT
jgi:hypothetical protein